jgi:hypothetical protein
MKRFHLHLIVGGCLGGLFASAQEFNSTRDMVLCIIAFVVNIIAQETRPK